MVETVQGTWRLIEMPKVSDVRGNLTAIEGRRHVPFEIARVYYVYDVPSGSVRAAHAHKRLEQVFLAFAGSFKISRRRRPPQDQLRPELPEYWALCTAGGVETA